MPPTIWQRILYPFGALLYRVMRPTLAEVWDEAAEEMTEYMLRIQYEPHANGMSDPPVNPYERRAR